MKWQFSKFCFSVKHKGFVIIKNNFTGAVASLKEADYNELQNCINLGKISQWSTDLKGENGILVQDTIDEMVEFKKIFLETRENNQTLIVHFLPTLGCQFRCSYCFEKDISSDKRSFIKDEVIDSMLHFLDEYIAGHDIKILKIVFFGGEPLLKKDVITQVLLRLQIFSTARGIMLMTELITNGELLDSEICETLKKHNWTRLQVTLDGFKNTHNETRKRKDGEGTFDTIIKKIQLVVEGRYIDKIDLRINLSTTNYASIKKLIKYLVLLNLVDVFNITIGMIEIYRKNNFSNLSGNIEEENIDSKMANNFINLLLFAKDMGFNIQDEFVAGPICIATMINSVVIQPDGGMQKCFCSVGMDEYNFGNIIDNTRLNLRDPRFEFFEERIKRCIEEKCPFIPICNGGCVWRSVDRHGYDKGFKERSCQRKAMQIINGGLMKSMI